MRPLNFISYSTYSEEKNLMAIFKNPENTVSNTSYIYSSMKSARGYLGRFKSMTLEAQLLSSRALSARWQD